VAVAVGGHRSLLTSGGLPEVFYCRKSGGSHIVTSHATASVLAAERATAAEAEQRHYSIMIESMVREGCSEREIDARIRALRR
jgi:hypothetical protein